MGGHRENVYVKCSGCVMFWLLARFGESFHTYTLGRFQFHGLLVSFSSPTHAHTYPYTRTLSRAYARARTLAARQSVQSILGGGIPAACVHDCVKVCRCDTIPESSIMTGVY